MRPSIRGTELDRRLLRGRRSRRRAVPARPLQRRAGRGAQGLERDDVRAWRRRRRHQPGAPGGAVVSRRRPDPRGWLVRPQARHARRRRPARRARRRAARRRCTRSRAGSATRRASSAAASRRPPPSSPVPAPSFASTTRTSTTTATSTAASRRSEALPSPGADHHVLRRPATSSTSARRRERGTPSSIDRALGGGLRAAQSHARGAATTSSTRTSSPAPWTRAARRSALQGYNNATDRVNLFNQTDVTGTRRHGSRAPHAPRRRRALAAAHGQLPQHGLFQRQRDGDQHSRAVRRARRARRTWRSASSATDADNHARADVGALYVQDQVELSPQLAGDRRRPRSTRSRCASTTIATIRTSSATTDSSRRARGWSSSP